MLTFLIHASEHFEKQYKVLERSIKNYEPTAEIIRIHPTGASDGKTYVRDLPRQRFSDVLRLLNEGKSQVILIGADMVLYGKVPELDFTMFDNYKYNMILTSHVNHPCTPIQPFYATGMAQGDLMAFNNTEEAKTILQWLLAQDLNSDDKGAGKFYEQTVLTTIPYLFSAVKILRNDTYNVAWYNLHERSVTKDDNYTRIFHVNGSFLTIFHFSGFDKDHLSRHCPNFNPQGAIKELTDWYAKELEV